MYRVVRILFYDRTERELELFRKYESYIPKKYVTDIDETVHISLTLRFMSFELSEAIRDADSMGLRYILFSAEVMTKAEAESAEYYYWMLPQYKVYGEPEHKFNTEYRYVCPKCGMKSHPIDVAYADRTTLNRMKIGDIYPDIFVNNEIRTLFEDAGFDGISFDVKAADRKGNIDERFRIMTIDSVMPPMNRNTWLSEETFAYKNKANACGHDTYYLRSDIYYDRSTLADAKDFNRTYEHLDNFSERYLIVSARVRELARKSRINVGRFSPVIIE